MLSNMQSVRDIEGYIIDPEEWSQDLARELAAEEGVELNGEYWLILDFMRTYWLEHRVAPDFRHVIEYLVSKHGYEKKKQRNIYSIYSPMGM